MNEYEKKEGIIGVGVKGVPGTGKPLEISEKNVSKFGKNQKTAQEGTKWRTLGMLGTKKPHGKIEKPHKKLPRTAKLQTSDTPHERVGMVLRSLYRGIVGLDGAAV